MAWIKRNLFFVIGMAAGLILTGYCGWLFMGARGVNTDVNTEYQTDLGQYNDLRGKGLSEESITRAREDVQHVKEFADEARKAYALFPPPPKEDEKGFSEYLANTLSELKLKATNAEVGLPADFAFSFTDQQHKLNYPQENIGPWMQQLTEIKALCDILFAAKINSVVSWQRVQVSGTDRFATGTDQLLAGEVSLPIATITPYKFTIRCFTAELAAVMDGLARSSNCFIIKNIVVVPAEKNLTDTSQPNTPTPTYVPAARVPFRPPRPEEDRRAYSEESRNYYLRLDAKEKREAAAAAAGAAAPVAAVTILTSGPATTVLREHLLFITLSVDVLKFKGAGH